MRLKTRLVPYLQNSFQTIILTFNYIQLTHLKIQQTSLLHVNNGGWTTCYQPTCDPCYHRHEWMLPNLPSQIDTYSLHTRFYFRCCCCDFAFFTALVY